MKTIETSLYGRALIDHCLLNKGTAFTEEERDIFRLRSLLPPHVETLETQIARAYDAFGRKSTDMERHIFLRAMQDRNETLFYRFISEHLKEMMPLIYTPVVGAACERFSDIYRRPRGLFLSYPDAAKMRELLMNWGQDDVSVIVVTDGERILGLGDQGCGGMGIPIGKLSLYTVCGGVDPRTTLPVVLDVGTNNEDRLADPFYIGWRNKRISGDAYVAFVDHFVYAVKEVWPNVLLQFEDFARPHATPLLSRYRDRLCMFNDDVQGTAAVTLGTLLAAVEVKGERLSDQRIVVGGGGAAGCGIAKHIISSMMSEGLTEEDARKRFFIIDRAGLLHSKMTDLLPFQNGLVQDMSALSEWSMSGEGNTISLLDVMRNAKATVLIGASGQPGLFTEEVVREMAKHCEHPITFPLSNPTSRMEAHPRDIIQWTEGRALVATGSPIPPVDFKGKSYEISQCNNTYIFPAIGLAVTAAKISRISDLMLQASSKALGHSSPALQDPNAPLLPPIANIREVSKDIAFAVAKAAMAEGFAEKKTDEVLKSSIESAFWDATYPALVTPT